MNQIRSTLRRVLAWLGLTTRRRTESLQEANARVKTRADKLRRRLTATRADLLVAKSEAARAKKVGAVAVRKLTGARTLNERLKAERDKWKRAVHDSKKYADGLNTSLREMQRKLNDVDQSTRLAHEHLMSTEVKLDLVDAAIRTLDDRTRAVLPNGPVVGATSSPGSSKNTEGK